MTTLPFAPLTHDELNTRHDEARMRAGHYVAAVLRHERLPEFSEGDIRRLRDYTEEADAYLAAARARMGGDR